MICTISFDRATEDFMAWTAEQDTLLKSHIDHGMSCSESAAILGCSPAAAVSRAFRLNWRFRSGEKGGRRRRRAPSPDGRAPVAMERLRPPPPAPAARPWLTRRSGECAYPVDGEGIGTLSCCAPSGEGGYCRAHARHMRRLTQPLEEFITALEAALNIRL
jgi:hypothetical protein